jgi:hypothetical protein
MVRPTINPALNNKVLGFWLLYSLMSLIKIQITKLLDTMAGVKLHHCGKKADNRI